MDCRFANLCTMASVNEARLNAYLAAEAKVLGGQSVRFGERELRRADLSEIRAEIGRLQILVARERSVASGRGGRFSQADFGGNG